MIRTGPNLTCPLCSAASHLKFGITEYVKHIRIFHAHDPSFKITCGINGCQRTYSNFRTFVNHVSSVHTTDFTATSATTESQLDSSYLGSYEQDMQYSGELSSFTDVSNQGLLCTSYTDSLLPREKMKRSVATFLLGL